MSEENAPAVAPAPAEKKEPKPKKVADPSEKKSLVVQSAVREIFKAKEMKISASLFEEWKLSEKLEGIINAAIERATANGRKTVMAYDL